MAQPGEGQRGSDAPLHPKRTPLGSTRWLGAAGWEMVQAHRWGCSPSMATRGGDGDVVWGGYPSRGTLGMVVHRGGVTSEPNGVAHLHHVPQEGPGATQYLGWGCPKYPAGPWVLPAAPQGHATTPLHRSPGSLSAGTPPGARVLWGRMFAPLLPPSLSGPARDHFGKWRKGKCLSSTGRRGPAMRAARRPPPHTPAAWGRRDSSGIWGPHLVPRSLAGAGGGTAGRRGRAAISGLSLVLLSPQLEEQKLLCAERGYF